MTSYPPLLLLIGALVSYGFIAHIIWRISTTKKCNINSFGWFGGYYANHKVHRPKIDWTQILFLCLILSSFIIHCKWNVHWKLFLIIGLFWAYCTKSKWYVLIIPPFSFHCKCVLQHLICLKWIWHPLMQTGMTTRLICKPPNKEYHHLPPPPLMQPLIGNLYGAFIIVLLIPLPPRKQTTFNAIIYLIWIMSYKRMS